MSRGYAVCEITDYGYYMLIVPKTPATCQAVFGHCYIALCNKMYLDFNLNMFYYVNKCNCTDWAAGIAYI